MTGPATVRVTPQEFDDAGRRIAGFQDRADGTATRLRPAASAWFAAADEVTSLGADVHAVLSGLVDTNDGDDVRALAAYWDRVGRSDSALFVALPRTCTALGQTCVRFAAAIDDAHRAMLDVIGQVLLGAVLVGVGIALTVPTLGGSDVVAGGAGAAAIATAVGELGTLAAALLATVGTAVAVTGVVTAGDALVAAIDNAPDPRVTQADISRVGDGLGKGSVDESARKFLPHERRTADRLAERGHDVRARPEDHSVKGRKADADVDGVETEFKSVTQEGKQDSSTIRNQLNDSKRDGGQSRNIVIDGADSELTAAEADRGIKRFIGIPGNYFDKITIITREGWVTWP